MYFLFLFAHLVFNEKYLCLVNETNSILLIPLSSSTFLSCPCSLFLSLLLFMLTSLFCRVNNTSMWQISCFCLFLLWHRSIVSDSSTWYMMANTCTYIMWSAVTCATKCPFFLSHLVLHCHFYAACQHLDTMWSVYIVLPCCGVVLS